jgi:hypothetical protein
MQNMERILHILSQDSVAAGKLAGNDGGVIAEQTTANLSFCRGAGENYIFLLYGNG